MAKRITISIGTDVEEIIRNRMIEINQTNKSEFLESIIKDGLKKKCKQCGAYKW
jgi:hypothetical protein